MNIFWLDTDPATCVSYYIDRHVVKMPSEFVQLLCGAHHACDGTAVSPLLWKPAYMNHPCAVWVRQSKANYEALFALYFRILDEYKYRYDKDHGAGKIRHELSSCPRNIPLCDRSSPPRCFNNVAPDPSLDTVADYRRFYRIDKQYDKSGKPMAVWTKRKQPEWW